MKESYLLTPMRKSDSNDYMTDGTAKAAPATTINLACGRQYLYAIGAARRVLFALCDNNV
jgi:hypothetical protein